VAGALELSDVRITGGQDGVFVAGGTANLHDLEVTDAGHAGIKPAGTSVVTIEVADIHHNKDAVEPICESTVTVSLSEIHCNGNGIEALGDATTTAIDNHVYNNNIGFGARGGATNITLRGNLIELNKFGVMEIFGGLDMGVRGDPGNNTLQNNAYAGLVASVVMNDIFAVDNTWEPNVDGADGGGLYSGAVSFWAGPATCPNTPLGSIDTAWDPNCALGFATEPGFQNVAIEDGGCDGGTAASVGIVIVSE
jgi:hypothetical protein